MPFQKSDSISHTQGNHIALTSLGRGITIFLGFHVNPPNSGPNSSFSIRQILGLPEESADERFSCSSNCSPSESSTVSLPVVPRPVRPMVHRYGDNELSSGLIN